MEIWDRILLANYFAYPKMLYIAAGTIFCLGLFTPINDLLTIPIAGLLAFGGYRFSNIPEIRSRAVTGNGRRSTNQSEMKSPESVINLLNMDPIEFEFGYGLIPLADANQGGDLLDRIVMIRRQLAIELGMSFQLFEFGIIFSFNRMNIV